MIDTLLHDIVAFKKAQLQAAMKIRPEGKLLQMIEQNSQPLPLLFDRQSLSIIAEIKPASPVSGTIRPKVDPGALAAAYQKGGASAISVLTEERFFKGSPSMLREAKRTTGIPIMRKDFIFHPYQVIESRAITADGILLIARILKDTELKSLLALAEESGMFVIVETFDERDVERALEAGAAVIGINSRDLRDFSVKLDRFAILAEKIPADRIRIAESGIKTARDVQAVRKLGFHGVLIGETLMKAGNPAALLREFKEAAGPIGRDDHPGQAGRKDSLFLRGEFIYGC